MKPARDPRPFLLPPNLVWRSYLGGKVLRQFRGVSNLQDDHLPEDWLASTVRARNGVNSQGADEGLSHLGDGEAAGTLPAILETDPGFWLGDTHAARTGAGHLPVLWKLLDAAVRLHIQAHPTANFARENLGSQNGKTECWYILATRGEGWVYLGFQSPPSREAWREIIADQNIPRMEACFEKIPIKAGDCLVVPAGTPHAIGPGVFMLELQEPTDWVVRCEVAHSGLHLTPDACFMGLGLERCLDVFNYATQTVPEVLRHLKQTPAPISAVQNFLHEEIIGAEYQSYFRLQRLAGTGTSAWRGGELMMLLVLKGSGHLRAGGKHHAEELASGQAWLLPGSVQTWDWDGGAGEWELLVALLPRMIRP
jgi:mannose-6-phosphate isomerase